MEKVKHAPKFDIDKILRALAPLFAQYFNGASNAFLVRAVCHKKLKSLKK